MQDKLTPRQQAGKLNRAKRKGLSYEGREALRVAALRNKPWESSTGPTTLDGKRRSRRNSLRHGGFAFTLLPIPLRRFIIALRKAERGEGPPPITDRPLRDYINRMRYSCSPRLLSRLERLMARYEAFCTLEHLSAQMAEMKRRHARILMQKGWGNDVFAPLSPPRTEQGVAEDMIMRLVQQRIDGSVSVLILDRYEDTWRALVRIKDGRYFGLTAKRTPDRKWSLLDMDERRLGRRG